MLNNKTQEIHQMTLKPSILFKTSTLSMFLSLTACGGGGGSSPVNTGGNTPNTPDTSGLKEVLPFRLEDNTGEVALSAILTSVAGLGFDSYHTRHRLSPEDFISEHDGVNPNNPDSSYPYIDKYIYRNCDSGSIGIKSNLPPPPHSGGAIDYFDLITLHVSANKCYSRSPNISAPKYVDGIADIRYENINTDEEKIRLSELKLQDYAIGFKSKLVNKNLDTDSYDAKKNHSLLLSVSRKTKNVSKKDSNTHDFKVFSASDVRKKVIYKHPKGDKVTFSQISYKANQDDGIQASYTMKWEVKNTKANIELLGFSDITGLTGIYEYGQERIFPVGNYELHYNYTYNVRTGIAIFDINLASHNISVEIVKTKTGTTITYNRSGNITVIKK